MPNNLTFIVYSVYYFTADIDLDDFNGDVDAACEAALQQSPEDAYPHGDGEPGLHLYGGDWVDVIDSDSWEHIQEYLCED